MALQQQALIAIKLLSVQLANDNVNAFRSILDILSDIVKKFEEIPVVVLAQSVLCLSEMCANLRANAISHLSKFMPALGKILKKQLQLISLAPNVIVYILSALYKIIETLPLFLSPYLVDILVSLSKIWSKLLVIESSEDTQKKLTKLEMIWEKLANVLSLRILVPTIDQSYGKLISEQEYAAVGPLMRLLSESLSHLNGTDIIAYQHDLGNFFVMALQFRSESKADSQVVAAQEDHVIKAFVCLVLKLSESSFRPLYYKVYDWAIRDGSSTARAITFYRYYKPNPILADTLIQLRKLKLFNNSFVFYHN